MTSGAVGGPELEGGARPGAPIREGGLEPVIGLEIHVQLATVTKLFCGDRVEFGAEPNTHVCPVCLGLPGALPVLNEAAVRLALRAAVALNCTIHETSRFARKNYFYPDLPKGYQITQHDRPLATDGWLEAGDADGESGEGGPVGAAGAGDHPSRVRIRRIHLEEDAGRTVHDRDRGRTLVDLNRAGTPLIEIVTEPDVRSPEQARRFLDRLKRLIEYIEVSDCDMEKGSLRVDANLSVRRAGTDELGTGTEVKNMNSFSNVGRALRFEAERQSRLVEEGGRVARATLLWDADAGEARPMRAKEESTDYRYFPDPDLPPLVLPPGMVAAARAALPELPAARAHRLREAYGLPAYDAGVLTASRALADYFERTAAATGDPKAASNWIMTVVLGWLNEQRRGIEELPLEPDRLAELIRLVLNGAISSSMGRELFARVVESDEAPGEIVEREGLAQVRDEDRLEQWVDAVLAEHPEEARRLTEGESKLLGFFVGQVMQRSQGKADPRRVSALIRDRAGP